MTKPRFLFSSLRDKIDGHAVLPALFLACLCSFFFLSKKGFSFSGFDYSIIGSAVLSNINVDKRILVITISILVFAISGLIGLFLFSLLLSHKDAKTIEAVSGVGIVVLIYRVMCLAIGVGEFYVDYRLFLTEIPVIGFIFLYFTLCLFFKNLDEKKAIYSLLFSLIFVYSFQEISFCLFEQAPYNLTSFATGIIVFSLSFFTLIVSHVLSQRAFYGLVLIAFSMAVVGILNALLLEGFLILNTRGIFLTNIKSVLLVNYLVAIVFGIFFSFFGIQNNLFEKRNSVLIVGTLLLMLFKAYQPGVTNNYFGADLYELSNGAVSVFGYLQYGKIPVLETFSAHMAGDVFFQIIYGRLSGDYVGAAISTFFNNYLSIVISIILYGFLRLFFERFPSFMIVAFFPFAGLNPNFQYMAFGLISVVALVHLFKTKTVWSCLLYLLSIVACILYKLDVGAAFAVGTSPFFVYCVIKSFTERRTFLSLLVTSFCFVTLVLGVIVVAAAIRHVPLFTRIDEFLQLAASNNRWGYAELGPTKNFAYLLYTWLIPPLVLVLFFFYWKKYGGRNVYFVPLAALVLATVFNFGRGLVRHTLVENTYVFVVGIAWLLVPLILALLLREKTNGSFPLLTFATMAICALSVTQPVLANDTVFTAAISLDAEKYQDHTSYVERVKVDEATQASIVHMKALLDSTLEPHETFMALAWHSPGYYVFAERECPVYENQVTGILSNVKSQQHMIRQWDDRDDVILAFTDESCPHLDNVCPQIQLRHVYKYLSWNYVPCFRYNGYVCWIKNGYQERVLSRIQNANPEVKDGIIFDDLLRQNEHIIWLGQTPAMAAAEFSGLTFSNSYLICKNDDENLFINNAAVDPSRIPQKENAYFHITINSPNLLHGCFLTFMYEYQGTQLSESVSFSLSENGRDYYFYLDSTILWNWGKLTKIAIANQRISLLELVW